MGDLTCGIDVGGTKISGAVVDEHGGVVEERTIESPAEDGDAIETAINTLVTDLRSRHDLVAVGVGAAAYIDAARARVLFAPNLAWRDLDLKDHLETRLGLPVVVENDGNAAAWGEFRFGAAAEHEDILMVTVGTGVGGGLVTSGQLVRGAYGVAAEIGHLRVVPQGLECGCGRRGCLEQYGSGSALVRQARIEAAADPTAARVLLERAGGSADAITGPMVTEVAQAGDRFARSQFDFIGNWLGEGLASLAAVLDPSVVVVGGGVSHAGDLLMTPLREAFERELIARTYRPVADILLAALGNRAGVVGAADLARL
ncbi:ROK family glucokinase [Nocardioides salsibiostraticola]